MRAATCRERHEAGNRTPRHGGDETIVHRRLNEGVPVIAGVDRFAEFVRRSPGESMSSCWTTRFSIGEPRETRTLSSSTRMLSGAPNSCQRSVARAAPIGAARQPGDHHPKTADRSTVEEVRRASQRGAASSVATAYLAPGELISTATGQTLPLRVCRAPT